MAAAFIFTALITRCTRTGGPALLRMMGGPHPDNAAPAPGHAPADHARAHADHG